MSSWRSLNRVEDSPISGWKGGRVFDDMLLTCVEQSLPKLWPRVALSDFSDPF